MCSEEGKTHGFTSPGRGWHSAPMNLTLRALALTSIVAIAGCAAGSSSTPGPETAAPGSPSKSSSGPTAVVPASSASGAAPSSNLVLPHDDPALEARLPGAFEGKTLFKISVGPVSSVGNAGAEPIKALVDQLGDGSGNFSLAFANDPTAPDFNYFALRVPGADSAKLVESYAALTIADTRGAESDQVTLAGKSLTHVTAPGNPIGDVWFYAIDDTLFGVQAGSADKATALIQLLP